MVLRKSVGIIGEYPIVLHGFVIVAWFSVVFFCESHIVLLGLVQSNILDDHLETT